MESEDRNFFYVKELQLVVNMHITNSGILVNTSSVVEYRG
jgi:hypothetical protein